MTVSSYNIPGTVPDRLIPHHYPVIRVFPLSHFTAQENSPERVGNIFSITSHPTNSAAKIQICHPDFRIGASSRCHAVSHHLSPVPHFLPKTPFGNWGEGSICAGDWLLPAGWALALVSLLPGGMGWGLARVPSFKGTLSVYLAYRGPCGWLRRPSMLRANDMPPKVGPLEPFKCL